MKYIKYEHNVNHIQLVLQLIYSYFLREQEMNLKAILMFAHGATERLLSVQSVNIRFAMFSSFAACLITMKGS